MATIISAFPLNPTPIESTAAKTKTITAATLQTSTPSSFRPAPSPLPLPPPPPENQNALIATLFASQPFDVVQGSQVQIGWKSAGPLYSVSIRLVRQSPAPAKIIETWPDVLPGINTVTVAMPSNDNFNQTVRIELWCTNSANPIFPIACFKSFNFVIFPVIAGLPTLIINLPGVTILRPPPTSPEPANSIDEESVSSLMSSTGALITLVALSVVIAAVFGWHFWKHCREKRREHRESAYGAQVRQKSLSAAPWNMLTHRRSPPSAPPGLIISPPSPVNTVRCTGSSSTRSSPARETGPPRLGEMLFERTIKTIRPHATPIVPLPPPPSPLPLPPQPPPSPVRPRRPSVVPSLPTWSHRSESVVYLDTQRSDSLAYLDPGTDDSVASETSSFYSREPQSVPDKEEYSSWSGSFTSSSSSSGSGLDLDAFLLQLSQPPVSAPTRSNESHLLVLRLDKEAGRRQWRDPSYGYF